MNLNNWSELDLSVQVELVMLTDNISFYKKLLKINDEEFKVVFKEKMIRKFLYDTFLNDSNLFVENMEELIGILQKKQITVGLATGYAKGNVKDWYLGELVLENKVPTLDISSTIGVITSENDIPFHTIVIPDLDKKVMIFSKYKVSDKYLYEEYMSRKRNDCK